MVKRSLTRSTTTLELASVQRKNPQWNAWSNALRISVVWMCWGWERLSLDSIPRIVWAWLSLWDPLLKSKKGIENEHGRRIDFWKRLEDCHCSLICASVFGPPFSSCQGNAKERHGATPRWTSLLSSRCSRATSLPYWISCTDRRGYGFHPIVLIRLVTKECLPWRFYVTIVTPWEQN